MRTLFTILFGLVLLSGCAGRQIASENTSVHLHQSELNEWVVDYRLPEKTKTLVFARNPNVSREERWHSLDPNVEVLRIEGEDVVRRKDGQAFDRAEFRLTPTYRHLGKDYAPFSNFSDGGILVHTGRYFACLETCVDTEPKWNFSLAADSGGFVLLRGKLLREMASWEDSLDGTMIYVGDQTPIETERAWVLIDPAFPPVVSELLKANLPRLVDHFSSKFGELPRKPNFFASFDAEFVGSPGSQGGTLPDQMFMHFRGENLQKRLADPTFDLWLAWFFAHETVHMYQTRIADERESWLHEGAAEAFAALVVRDWSSRSSDYVQARRERASKECRAGLVARSLESVADGGEFDLYYSCGLILHLELDAAVRRKDSSSDGLFDLWTSYNAEVSGGAEPNGVTFRRVVAELAGTEIADWVKEFTTTEMPALAAPYPP